MSVHIVGTENTQGFQSPRLYLDGIRVKKWETAERTEGSSPNDTSGDGS